MLDIYLDADASPVKDAVFRVAERCGLHVYVVTNQEMRVPDEKWIELVLVGSRFDEADDWIVEHVKEDDIVITDDVPLAARCLKQNAWVVGQKGRDFNKDNIGELLGTRNLMKELRDVGMIGGGPKPFEKKDRSNFLDQLNTIIQKIRLKHRPELKPPDWDFDRS